MRPKTKVIKLTLTKKVIQSFIKLPFGTSYNTDIFIKIYSTFLEYLKK